MRNVTSYNLFLDLRRFAQNVCFAIYFTSIFTNLAYAQGTASPADKLDTPATSPAAGDNKSKAPAKGKKTTIDFEDQLIEGSRQKPELFYLLQNKDFNYKRLIRLREDFLPELRKSGEDVQGKSGGAQ